MFSLLKHCFSLQYSVIMLALFVLQVLLVLYIWIQRDELLNGMSTLVNEAWKQRKTNSAMDTIQISVSVFKLNFTL